ncbi:MAG: PQQ-like beta-propeller repeat protein [Labilithrix sp.]|nr:PQQ-like beta-propeller repeat protein [Labilithrix sp.]
MKRRALALVAVAVAAGAIAATLRDAGAQRIDPRRPSVLVVGAPGGAAPMQRVDSRRSGLSRTPLPSGTLRVAWRKTTGLTLDQPALSGPDGTLAVVSSRGDVSFLDAEGEERATVKVGAAQVGPAAITSDGTVVYASSGGDVIGVRRSSPQPRFSARIGGERNVRAAPLALDDGGVVVATISDLVVLDSEGSVRARVSLPEMPGAALVAAGDKILAVTTSGAVFGWTPGREPVRLGSFGAPIDGGAALTDAGTLLAVIEGNHLAEVDVSRGGRSTRSIAAQGLYLGPPAVRSGPSGATATLLALTHTRGFVVTLDPGGQELLRAPVASFSPATLPDGGAPPLVAPPHAGPIVDARGAIAFASTDGHVGVVGPDGAVDTLGEIVCAKGARSGVVGLTPFGANAFAVTCDGGVVVRVTGAAEPPQGAPAAPAISPSPSDPLGPGPAPSTDD